uniref:Uncharacterized protein n=1 Tax=Anguilla anguilla TaxID=7936 RepID=A0A0E9XTV2_ANGAN
MFFQIFGISRCEQKRRKEQGSSQMVWLGARRPPRGVARRSHQACPVRRAGLWTGRHWSGGMDAPAPSRPWERTASRVRG